MSVDSLMAVFKGRASLTEPWVAVWRLSIHRKAVNKTSTPQSIEMVGDLSKALMNASIALCDHPSSKSVQVTCKNNTHGSLAATFWSNSKRASSSWRMLEAIESASRKKREAKLKATNSIKVLLMWWLRARSSLLRSTSTSKCSLTPMLTSTNRCRYVPLQIAIY